MPTDPHRRTSSTTSVTTTTIKPPSVFRYTLILLKARPSATDINTISVYSHSRSAPPSPTLPPYQERERDYFFVPEERAETPPPPYEQ